MSKQVALLASIAVLAACAHPSAPDTTQLATAPKAYTLTNLHPDIGQHLLYSANYQQSGLIPRCSGVAMGDRTSKELAFTVTSTGVHYLYRLSTKTTPEGFDANIAKYFGSQCDSASVTRMSAIDRQGVHEGRVIVGMTKQGVIDAIGYPPASETPDTKGDRWLYWRSKTATFVVLFGNDVVTSVQ